MILKGSNYQYPPVEPVVNQESDTTLKGLNITGIYHHREYNVR